LDDVWDRLFYLLDESPSDGLVVEGVTHGLGVVGAFHVRVVTAHVLLLGRVIHAGHRGLASLELSNNYTIKWAIKPALVISVKHKSIFKHNYYNAC